MKFRLTPYLVALSALVVVVSGISLLHPSEQELFQQETRGYLPKELSAVMESQYPVRSKDELGTPGKVFVGNESIFPTNPVIRQVTLPNRSKPLATIMAGEWQSGISLTFLVRIWGVLGVLLTGITLFKWIQNFVKLRASLQAATEKLRDSEFQYRELVENANSIIMKVDTDGNITFFNDFAQKFFGYSEEEIIGKNVMETIIAQTDSAGNDLTAMARNILQHPEQYICNEHENIRQNGELVLVSWRNKAIVDDKGALKGILAIGNDISYRKQAQKAEKESLSLLQAVIESIPDPIFAKDLQGRYVLVNTATARALGRPVGEIIGYDDRQFMEPESARDVMDFDCHIATTGQSQSIENDLLLDGALRTFLSKKSVYRDAQGNTIGTIGIARDITEHKQAEIALQKANEELEMRVQERTADLRQALEHLQIEIAERQQAEKELRESEERWQLALKGNNDGIWDWNVKTNEIFLSAQCREIVGYEEHEIGNHIDEWTNILHPDDVGWVIDTMQDHLNHKTPYYVTEHRQRCKDGSYKWILGRAQALWDEEGKPVRVVGSQTDITNRKLAEEALQQSEMRERERAQQLEQVLLQLRSAQAQLIQTEKMSSLGQLVAGVAHEINNPVSFIHGNLTYVNDYVEDLLGMLELYQQEYPQPSEEILGKIEEIELNFITRDLAKVLSSMKVGTERIRSIVLSLRNFSRLDEYEMKQVDINEGIESTLLILQNRFKGKKNCPEIQLVKEFGKLPLLECYAGQLNQVFVNIIANAIDAIEERRKGLSVEEMACDPGRIDICTKVRDREIATIEISDNGTGMSEVVKAQIFNPFFTTKEIGSGPGLGMSVTYQIVVEQHKGKLNYISEIGKGTTFIVEIPIRQSC